MHGIVDNTLLAFFGYKLIRQRSAANGQLPRRSGRTLSISVEAHSQTMKGKKNMFGGDLCWLKGNTFLWTIWFLCQFTVVAQCKYVQDNSSSCTANSNANTQTPKRQGKNEWQCFGAPDPTPVPTPAPTAQVVAH